MDSMPLVFEEIKDTHGAAIGLEDQLVNEKEPSEFMCEAKLCTNKATDQWVRRDGDGHIYYTYRCDDHPVNDDDEMIKESAEGDV